MPENNRLTCFIDTNVWLYAFIESQDKEKARLAKDLIESQSPVISSQIVNEVCVNLLRQTVISETEIEEVIEAFYRRYTVQEVSREVLVQASGLRERHSFSFWDSIIVSSALRSGVPILYSEDMQDGLKVENRLEIRNPFKAQEIARPGR